MIFREFYPRGLTALDSLDEKLLGTRPTVSHVTARMEIEVAFGRTGLRRGLTSGDAVTQQERDAA